MSKQLCTLALILLSAVGLVCAQAPANSNEPNSNNTITITGNVKTGDGDALHLAFVQDKVYKAGVYTDSTGYFSLSVYPNSILHIKCFGFRDTLVQVKGQTTFNIVLRPTVTINGSRGIEATNADQINFADFRDMIMNGIAAGTFQAARDHFGKGGNTMAPIDMAQGAIFPVFTHKEATQGSRYLFAGWVHGYVVNNNDSLIQNPGYLYNYDKIDGNLLVTVDKHTAVQLYKTSVQSFTLFDTTTRLPHTFALLPSVDKDHYTQVISTGKNYSIFKLITTKFKKSDYNNNGITATGNDFDSYENEETYYVLNGKNGHLDKFSPRKKALLKAFPDQADKLKKFFDKNSGDIDDAYLANLCQYMNAE
jgi:hypothetical protein